MDRAAAPIGKRTRRLLVAIVAALSLALFYVAFLVAGATLANGCTAIPREGFHNATNAVRVVAEAVVQAREARRDEAGETGGGNNADPVQTANPAPSGGAAALVFKYGGFKGGGAVEDPATQIADVRITKDHLSYRWARGGCENFGAKSREDAGAALACAFFWSETEQAWIGGKFDWISSSRTTRDWKNLNGGYGGWDAKAFWAAPRRAFCIVAANGRKRTNLEVAK